MYGVLFCAARKPVREIVYILCIQVHPAYDCLRLSLSLSVCVCVCVCTEPQLVSLFVR